MQIANIINNDKLKFDKVDFKIITLLVLGYDNKKISSTLKIPLRYYSEEDQNNISFKDSNSEYIPNFKILGIKKGMLHIYLRDGSLKQRAETISKLDGILLVSIHVETLI